MRHNKCMVAEKSVSLLLLALALCLGGCASPPPQTEPVRFYPDVGNHVGTAYFWSSGEPRKSRWALYLTDVATFTHFDGIEIPERFLDRGFPHALLSGLLEVPSGQHQVEVVVEQEIPVCLGPCPYREVARKRFELIAEAGQVYTPYAEDFCGEKWIWIERSGPYLPGSPTERLTTDTTTGGEVVAGEAPRPVITSAAQRGVPECDPNVSKP